MEQSTGLVGVIIAAAIGLATIPLFGALSDRVGRRPVYLFGAAFSLLFAFETRAEERRLVAEGGGQ